MPGIYAIQKSWHFNQLSFCRCTKIYPKNKNVPLKLNTSFSKSRKYENTCCMYYLISEFYCYNDRVVDSVPRHCSLKYIYCTSHWPVWHAYYHHTSQGLQLIFHWQNSSLSWAVLLLVLYIKPLICSTTTGKIYLLQSIQTTSGAHPASYSLGTKITMPRYKAASATVKNECSYMSTAPICFHGMHKGQP